MTIYAFAILGTINFFPNLLPASINAKLLFQIISFMMAGYAFYVILNYPVNGFLFKYAETTKQKTIAIAYLTVLIVFPILFIFLNGGTKITEYRTLLITIWVLIFLLLITKSSITFLSGRKSELG